MKKWREFLKPIGPQHTIQNQLLFDTQVKYHSIALWFKGNFFETIVTMKHLILKGKKCMKIGKAIMNFDELGIQGDKKDLIPLPWVALSALRI